MELYLIFCDSKLKSFGFKVGGPCSVNRVDILFLQNRQLPSPLISRLPFENRVHKPQLRRYLEMDLKRNDTSKHRDLRQTGWPGTHKGPQGWWSGLLYQRVTFLLCPLFVDFFVLVSVCPQIKNKHDVRPGDECSCTESLMRSLDSPNTKEETRPVSDRLVSVSSGAPLRTMVHRTGRETCLSSRLRVQSFLDDQVCVGVSLDTEY